MPPSKKSDDPRPVHFCNHQTVVVPTLNGVKIYTTALDKTGALWERWSDAPEGVWHEVARPTRQP